MKRGGGGERKRERERGRELREIKEKLGGVEKARAAQLVTSR